MRRLGEYLVEVANRKQLEKDPLAGSSTGFNVRITLSCSANEGSKIIVCFINETNC
jgi:hypothetical protein